MIKIALAATAAVSALALAAPASAQMPDLIGAPQAYGTLGYSHGGYDDVDLGAVTGRLGARFGYLGVEGEGSFGVVDDSVRVAGTDVDVDINHQFAAYGVAFVPLNPNFDLLARIGYGTTELEASTPAATATGDGESWNYGVGAQYFFNSSKNGVRADYTHMDFTDNGGDADVFSVSYVRKF